MIFEARVFQHYTEINNTGVVITQKLRKPSYSIIKKRLLMIRTKFAARHDMQVTQLMRYMSFVVLLLRK